MVGLHRGFSPRNVFGPSAVAASAAVEIACKNLALLQLYQRVIHTHPSLMQQDLPRRDTSGTVRQAKSRVQAITV
jgi:hypothetical protein